MASRHRWLTRRAHAAAAAALALTGCAGGAAAGARAGQAPPPVAASSAALLEAWTRPLDELDPEAFAPVAAPEDLGPVLDDLSGWWRRFFRPEASPARVEGVGLSARAGGGDTPDLIRATYDMAVVRLDVLDSAAFTLVRIADPGVDVADGAAAQVIVRRVLAAGPDRRWDVAFPARLGEGEWYASDPSSDLGSMPSYRDRIDVRVRGGRLEILCAKRGEGARPALDGWFPPPLRERLAGAPR